VVTSSQQLSICQNQLPYTWNGQVLTQAGVYTATLQSATGCDSVVTLTLLVSSGTSSVTTTSLCASQLPFTWNGNSYNAPGTYFVTLVNQFGCDSVATLVLSVDPLATASITEPSTICIGTSKTISIHLTGTGPWTLTYSDGASNHTISNITTSPYLLTVTPLTTTTYTILSVFDGKCVNASPGSAVTITVVTTQGGIRYPVVRTQANVNTQLQARSIGQNNTYQWMPAIGLNNATIQSPVFRHNDDMEYTIRIRTASGCVIVDTVQVAVLSPAPVPTTYSNVFVPKAWSPNKDGHNDKLYPLTVKIKQLYYFRIFNRWGQLVFETNVLGQGWDGMFKGQPQVSDVYTWTLDAMGEDGKRHQMSGNAILLR